MGEHGPDLDRRAINGGHAMDHRRRRDHRPRVERAEARILLSTITDLMASNSIGHQRSALAKQASTLQYFMAQHTFPVRAAVAGGHGGGGNGAGTGSNGNNGGASTGFTPFTPSKTSIANPMTNQGQQGSNFALQPVGNLTPSELKREIFSASFQGTYTVSPGRTDAEAAVTLIKGAGHGTTFLHGDIQFRVVTPRNPTYVDIQGNTQTTQLGGVAAVFDRNLNSNSVLGLDAAGADSNVDASGRPIHFDKVTIDVNESAGLYDEAFAQGTIDVRYTPSRHHAKGLIEQGFAVVTIHAQIYGPNVDYILTNANINPGGPPP